MSEKRYYVNCAGYLCDNDLSNTLSIFECADLLNSLNEENRKHREEIINSHIAYVECLNEIKDLKQRIKVYDLFLEMNDLDIDWSEINIEEIINNGGR